jgi:lysophospholipase L1-like esterase
VGGRRFGWLLAAVLLLGALPGAGNPEAEAGGPRALFFGDSLMAGTGAEPRRPVQALEASRLLGWSPTVDAVGGTGFTTGGTRGRPYPDRLRTSRLLDQRFDVVVLEGGTNDAHHGSVQRLRQSAGHALDVLRRRQATARVIVLGAFTPAGPPSPRHLEIDRILREVAKSRSVEYVSQVRYGSIAGPGFYTGDSWHPTTAGYAVMGRDLARALSR